LVPAPVNEMVNCYITIIWLDMICHVPAPVNEMFNCYITIIWLDMICHVPAPVNEMVNCYITIKVLSIYNWKWKFSFLSYILVDGTKNPLIFEFNNTFFGYKLIQYPLTFINQNVLLEVKLKWVEYVMSLCCRLSFFYKRNVDWVTQICTTIETVTLVINVGPPFKKIYIFLPYFMTKKITSIFHILVDKC
jgi:hypothetical protein